MRIAQGHSKSQVTFVLTVLLLAAALAGSQRGSEPDLVAPAGPPEPGQPANWGPAMLTFVRGVEIWGTTGVREQPERLLDLRRGSQRTASAIEIGSIHWSPDGRRLVYDAYTTERYPPSIWQVAHRADGEIVGSPQCLCTIGLNPRLSPDGTLLACNVGDRGHEYAIADPRLVLVRLRPLGTQRVTDDLSSLVEPLLSATRGDHILEVAWSPDGRWIAYKTEQFPPGEDHLWVVGIDGSGPQQVASDLGGIGDIAWRRAVTPTSEKGE